MLMKNSRFIGLACLLNGCAAMIGRNEEDLAACSCTRLQHMFTQSSIVHVNGPNCAAACPHRKSN